MTTTDQTTHEPVDVDSLPLAQYLVLDDLAARYRTGETLWHLPKRARRHLEALAQTGLVGWRSGPDPETVQAWLTDAGRAAVLSPTYRVPVPVGRERIARYLDEAAARKRLTGLLSDEVTANAWAEAASWCRDDTIWADSPEEEGR